MKLLRVGTAGAERPALLDAEGTLRDLSGIVPDIDGPLLADTAALGRIRAAADAGELPALDADGLRVGPPLAGIGKVVCIGLNYHDHARETGVEPPAEPVVFFKAADTVVGPYDTVLVPRKSVKTDWEVELAIVIGKRASYVEEKDALAYIAGYAVCNDVSERAYQIEGTGQWMKGKGCPTFGPLGPWLVTPDEVGDVQNLDMWLDVDGERMQTGSTRTMIFSVAHIVHYISHFMIMEPGDVITTGTPPGVGMGKKPPRYLRPGEIISLGIEKLGTQRQTTLAWSA